MTKRLATLLAGLCLVSGPACGRKGPLELPPGRAPAAVEKLTAVQRGAAVVLEWTNPGKAVSGRPLGPLGSVEVWVLEGDRIPPGRTLRKADIEKTGRLVRRIAAGEFTGFSSGAGAPEGGMAFSFVFDPSPAGPKSLAFTVRIVDRHGRPSEFSLPAAVSLRPSPQPPTALRAEVRPDAVVVTWAGPDALTDGTRLEGPARFVVYRSEVDAPAIRMTPGLIDGARFEDRDFEFGRSYRYLVRAVVGGPGGSVESSDSTAVAVVPRDVFPPDPPGGLVILAGAGLVSLSWRPGTEPDLDGYRVSRRAAGQTDFVPVSEGIVRGNTFIDRSVAKGVSYVYGVSALDRSGNASRTAESEPVVAKGAGA